MRRTNVDSGSDFSKTVFISPMFPNPRPGTVVHMYLLYNCLITADLAIVLCSAL